MKFIDWFAGIGGFREGMEQAGHKCVGFCEFDKFAYMSYVSMHCITEEQRKYLLSLPMTERQKEIMKEKYLNGEWYSNDIRHVYPDAIPAAEMWCAGFPCQDISVAGKQLGFTGNRSSLFSELCTWLNTATKTKDPTSLSLRTLKICLVLMEDGTSPGFSLKWTGEGTMRNGKFSILPTSEYHSTENACSLSDILEENPESRFFLSKEKLERIVWA